MREEKDKDRKGESTRVRDKDKEKARGNERQRQRKRGSRVGSSLAEAQEQKKQTTPEAHTAKEPVSRVLAVGLRHVKTLHAGGVSLHRVPE